MNITIFLKSTGQILQTMSIPLGMANVQPTNDDQDWIEGNYPDDRFYVNGFTPVPMPQRPSQNHEFNYTTKQWEDPRTLADLKVAKNEAINAARLRANRTHFTFQGKQIRTDEASFMDIMGAHGDWVTGQAPANWPGGWKTVDNSYVTIPDQATWMAFYRAMVATGTANFNHAQVLKAQLAEAQTPSEVDGVPDW